MGCCQKCSQELTAFLDCTDRAQSTMSTPASRPGTGPWLHSLRGYTWIAGLVNILPRLYFIAPDQNFPNS